MKNIYTSYSCYINKGQWSSEDPVGAAFCYWGSAGSIMNSFTFQLPILESLLCLSLCSHL